MRIELNMGEEIIVSFKDSDGEIKVTFTVNRIAVEADLADSSGRKGIIYEEKVEVEPEYIGDDFPIWSANG